MPVLIVADNRRLKRNTPSPEKASGRRFFANERDIRRYLSAQYDLPEAG